MKSEGGAIVGVEALLRWTHASRGPIPPSVFVRVAEEAGLMDQLGEFVLRRALADAARWPSLYVSVNLSPVQMRDRKFLDLMSAVLTETAIAPSRIVLEITESVLIDDPETAKSRLEDLRALGVKLALDDFGSGYSSLAYLQRLPFDKLKIDRGFVAALEHSANAGVIIQAIVALGRALGLDVLDRGRGDRGAAGPDAARRLQRDARVPVRQASAARGHRPVAGGWQVGNAPRRARPKAKSVRRLIRSEGETYDQYLGRSQGIT